MFRIATVQTVIFTPGVATFSQANVLASFLQGDHMRYNGPITALPLPIDAPPQVPRVMLQSADGTWKLNAAPSRIDSLWSPSAALAEPEELAALVAQSGEVLETYVATGNIQVDRLALLINRARTIDNPAESVMARFCSDAARHGPFNQSRGFEIHSHKVDLIEGFPRTVNLWMRCKTALILGEPGFVVEQDLNTLEEQREGQAFDAAMIHDFLTEARVEAERQLRLFFPDEV